jgi:hypothetical protein
VSREAGRRVWLIGALLLLAACQATPPPPLAETSVPAGRTLVRDGISGDGTRVVALADDPAACRVPEVWERVGSGPWREVVAGPPVGDPPCPSVTAQVAPDGASVGIHDYGAGRADILRLADGTFMPAATATVAGEPGSRFPPPGPNLALAGDGHLLLGSINRGCRTLGGTERQCGVAELFERQDGAWRSTAILLPPADRDGVTRFGQTVALTGDGSLALAGGTGQTGDAGALWVYRLREPRPEPVQELTAPDGQAGFANALSLAAGGGWLAVGGEQSVHLFERTGDGFAWRETLGPPDRGAGYFGETVALSADGRWLLVGAPRTDCPGGGGDRCGVAYLFERATAWSLARTIRPSAATPEANFGHHLALSGDGRHAAIQGAVIHVFTLDR